MTNNELIEKARSVLNPQKVCHDFWSGDVGAAILTDKGNVYLGVCIDMPSGIGFCAEHSAIAAMVTGGEFRIKKIVAVWQDKVIPPCGRCREFIKQVHKDNLDTEVIISHEKTVQLRELLPYHEWLE